MALVKKGSRRITVDGVPYRWRVRARPTYGQGLVWSPLIYAVEQAGTRGTILVVTTNQPHPSNWFEIPGRPVLPAEVAATIRMARAAGWTPDEPGSPFLLDRSQGFVPAG
ncbi:hypothetical protein DMB38_07795 [Streptomyces sp. WAC 06738]|uniref:hypothetical protein n=1 Tax=Streptomyces sp. WAC 06738 TaxID=2203210 RepID=UPI000F6F4060|nr:hypothetical protein [Streptomyces sp. WAC 06738]AZM45745.1 hypothetical protein DMB38_07795 [Streptomyces sp. WAC 06738]